MTSGDLRRADRGLTHSAVFFDNARTRSDGSFLMKSSIHVAAIIAAIACSSVLLAQDAHVKPAIRGLVSMGAFKFVGSGGDPVNTLEPLKAKPDIFGGLVVIASWEQLQPDGPSELGSGNVIDKAMAEVRDYNAQPPEKPLAVRVGS